MSAFSALTAPKLAVLAGTLLVNSSAALGQPEEAPATSPETAATETAATERSGTPEFGESGVIAVEAATGLEVSSTSTRAAQGEDPESVLTTVGLLGSIGGWL